MIRKIAMLAAAAAALAIPPAVQAQQKDAVKIGIGASIEAFNYAQFGAMTLGAVPANVPVSVYVPIQITPHLRIEPSLGLATYSQDRAAAALGTGEVSGHAWNIGVGVLYYLAPAQPAGFYVGGRLGLVFSGRTTVNGANTVLTEGSETDFYLRGVLGGEYYLAPRFSVGVEAQLGPTFYGNESLTVTPGPSPATVSRNLTGWNTSGLVFARFFF